MKTCKNIVAIAGGMGNQMFHYALSLALENKTIRNDYLTKIGFSNYGSVLSVFSNVKLKRNTGSNFLIWFIRKCIVFTQKKNFYGIALFLLNCIRFLGININTDYAINKKIKHTKKPAINLYFGRFQSEKYFTEKEKFVRNIFDFDETKLSEKTQETVKRIKNENSVSVHIRRGDFLKPANIIAFGNICTLEYYQNAITHIIKNVENPVFYIFSDDIAWVKENLELPRAFYVNWNTGTYSWEDMYLMSQCKHNIVANSTFSWWGAWLNNYQNKIVIRPPKYVNNDDTLSDFYPASWLKISNK